MCIICVDFEKGRMTSAEARRALGEMVVKVGREHAAEVEQKLRNSPDGAQSGPVPAVQPVHTTKNQP